MLQKCKTPFKHHWQNCDADINSGPSQPEHFSHQVHFNVYTVTQTVNPKQTRFPFMSQIWHKKWKGFIQILWILNFVFVLKSIWGHHLATEGFLKVIFEQKKSYMFLQSINIDRAMLWVVLRTFLTLWSCTHKSVISDHFPFEYIFNSKVTIFGTF